MNSFASSRLLNIMIIGWRMRRPRIFWLQSYFIFTPHAWEFWFFNFFAIIIFQYRISYEKPMDLNWIMHHFFLAVFKILFYFIIIFFIYFCQLEANYPTTLQWLLSYIDMNQPWIYMYSPSRSPLPPPSLPDPSGSSQCTRPEHLSHTPDLGWWSVSP